MSFDDSYSIEILKYIIIYLHRYIIPVIYVIGNIGHLLTALVFSKKSWRKNVCVFYFNVCLISNTCYINTSTLASIFIFGFDINLQNSNTILCKINFYTAYIFSTLLPTFLILASIDRLLISSQNVDTRLYSSKRLAYLMISISTCFWSIFLLHIVIRVNLQQFGPSTFSCYYDLSPSYLQFASYSSVIFSGFLGLIMFILCMLAFKNVRRIRAIPRQQRQQIRTMTKKDFQLLRCLFIQDIVYIIFTTGLTISNVYKALTLTEIRSPLEEAIIDFIYKFSIFMNNIPYCGGFFIFIVMSKAFRNELKRMIYKICGKDITLIREEENKQQNVRKDIVELNVVVL